MSTTINQLYEDARKKHSDIVSLDIEDINVLVINDERQRRIRSTRVVVLLFTLLPFIYILICVAIPLTWRLDKDIAEKLADYDYSSLKESVPGLSIGLTSCFLATLMYYIITPLISIAGGWYAIHNSRKLESSILIADYSSRSYIISAFICCWLSICLGTVAAASLSKLTREHIELAFKIWMLCPAIILSISPLLLATQIVAILVEKQSRGAPTRNRIQRDLLSILKDWPIAGTRNLESKRFQSYVSHRLAPISADISNLYCGKKSQNPAQAWAVKQFSLAADNLLVCASWLYVPKPNTLNSVRSRIVVYCNAFLTGYLDDLPREVLDESRGLISVKPKRRIMRTIFLTFSMFIYCAVPVIVFCLFGKHLIPLGVPDSIWLLTYSLWLAVGIYGYLEHTSQEGASKVIELIKALFGR